jgi:hypothetical protein
MATTLSTSNPGLTIEPAKQMNRTSPMENLSVLEVCSRVRRRTKMGLEAYFESSDLHPISSVASRNVRVEGTDRGRNWKRASRSSNPKVSFARLPIKNWKTPKKACVCPAATILSAPLSNVARRRRTRAGMFPRDSQRVGVRRGGRRAA